MNLKLIERYDFQEIGGCSLEHDGYWCKWDDVQKIIESQQRIIDRLTAPMTWSEYNSIFPVATDPMAPPLEILLHSYEVWNLLLENRKNVE